MDDKIRLPATEQETGKETQLGIANVADDIGAAAAAVAITAVAVAVAGKDVLPEFQPSYT